MGYLNNMLHRLILFDTLRKEHCSVIADRGAQGIFLNHNLCLGAKVRESEKRKKKTSVKAVECRWLAVKIVIFQDEMPQLERQN
jgi:hypothetical protein